MRTIMLSPLVAVAFLFLLGPSCLALDERDEAILSWNTRSILSARNSATISAEASSRVLAIHFEPGQAFQAGDVLVELDNRLPRIRLESARAALRAADAGLEATSQMVEGNNASILDLETAKRDRAQAWARLEEIALELDACTIRAPFGGRVVEVLVNAHELVSRGAEIISIADDSLLLAHFIFPENRWGEFSIGDVMAIEVPLVDVTANATVSRISSGLDPASHTFEVWADVDNVDGHLRTGMTARIAPPEGPSP